MVSTTRAQRIAERIREELSEIMVQQVVDPRLEGVNITDVTVDRELSYASVFVSALEGAQRSPEALDALRHAQGFLRSELARRIDLRSFPRLRFQWDSTAERAEHIEQLLASLHDEQAPGSPPESDDHD